MATWQITAAIAATWAKAKLLGLDKSTSHIEQEVTMPTRIELVAPSLKSRGAD